MFALNSDWFTALIDHSDPFGFGFTRLRKSTNVKTERKEAQIQVRTVDWLRLGKVCFSRRQVLQSTVIRSNSGNLLSQEFYPSVPLEMEGYTRFRLVE